MDLVKLFHRVEYLANINKCICTPCRELREYRKDNLQTEVEGLRKVILKLQEKGKDSAKVEDLA